MDAKQQQNPSFLQNNSYIKTQSNYRTAMYGDLPPEYGNIKMYRICYIVSC